MKGQAETTEILTILGMIVVLIAIVPVIVPVLKESIEMFTLGSPEVVSKDLASLISAAVVATDDIKIKYTAPAGRLYDVDIDDKMVTVSILTKDGLRKSFDPILLDARGSFPSTRRFEIEKDVEGDLISYYINDVCVSGSCLVEIPGETETGESEPTPPIELEPHPSQSGNSQCPNYVATQSLKCEADTKGAAGDTYLEACWNDLGDVGDGNHRYEIVWHLIFNNNELEKMISGDFAKDDQGRNGYTSGFVYDGGNSIVLTEDSSLATWPTHDQGFIGSCNDNGHGNYRYCYFNYPEGECRNCDGACGDSSGKVPLPHNYIIIAEPETKINGFLEIKGGECPEYTERREEEDKCDYVSAAKNLYRATPENGGHLIMILGG